MLLTWLSALSFSFSKPQASHGSGERFCEVAAAMSCGGKSRPSQAGARPGPEPRRSSLQPPPSGSARPLPFLSQ